MENPHDEIKQMIEEGLRKMLHNAPAQTFPDRYLDSLEEFRNYCAALTAPGLTLEQKVLATSLFGVLSKNLIDYTEALEERVERLENIVESLRK